MTDSDVVNQWIDAKVSKIGEPELVQEVQGLEQEDPECSMDFTNHEVVLSFVSMGSFNVLLDIG